jgi:hypothetical protein
MDALKVFIQQLFKNFQKQPGWIPLLVEAFLGMKPLELLELSRRPWRSMIGIQ